MREGGEMGDYSVLLSMRQNDNWCECCISPVEAHKIMFCGMDDVLWLILLTCPELLGISRVPLWHPWGNNFTGQNKMAAGDCATNHQYPVTSLVLMLQC